MSGELDDKIRGILGLYNFYKHQMNTPQRIALLTMWIESCVSKEEYEVAGALQKEMDKILEGEEDYILIPTPSIQFHPPSIDEIKNRIAISMSEKKIENPKIRFINLWNSGEFVFFNLTFGANFRFIIFNIGLARK